MDVVSTAEQLATEIISWVPAVLGAVGGLVVTTVLLGVLAIYELGRTAGSQQVVKHRTALVAVSLVLGTVFGVLVVSESLVVLGVL